MENKSLNRIAWIKFKQDKLALVSLIFIFSIIFLAFFGQFLMPDKTPMANQMHVELSTLRPITTITFISDVSSGVHRSEV